MENATVQARRDLRKAWLHLLAAFGAAGVMALLAIVFPPPPVPPDTIPKIRATVAVLLMGTLLYGMGECLSLNLRARRRLGNLNRMRQLPAARVIQRNRNAAS